MSHFSTEFSSIPASVCLPPPYSTSWDTTWNFTYSRESQGCQRLPTTANTASPPAFIGPVNFYHHFLPHCAELMQPLHSLLKEKSQSLTWTEAATTAFQATKEALANASLLTYPTPNNSPTCLMTDTADTAVGAVLQQHINGTWKPISFFLAS